MMAKGNADTPPLDAYFSKTLIQTGPNRQVYLAKHIRKHVYMHRMGPQSCYFKKNMQKRKKKKKNYAKKNDQCL
jgi:hypothetical protein